MRERKRKNFNQGYRGGLILGKASVLVVGIGLTFALGLLYLSQANGLAVRGYALTELEKKKAELTAEKERLEIEATRLQSIQEIQKATGESSSKFVPIKKINYLPSSNVAVK